MPTGSRENRMTEPVVDPVVDPATDPTSSYRPPASQEEFDRIIADRVNRTKAQFKDYNDLKSKAAEFDKLAEAQKTEAQKALDRAEKAEARAVEASLRSVRSEIKSIATGEFAAPDRIHGLLGDLSRFVGKDGEPDASAIEAALKDLEKEAPELVARSRTDVGLGTRGGGGSSPSMNDLIRRAAGR